MRKIILMLVFGGLFFLATENPAKHLTESSNDRKSVFLKNEAPEKIAGEIQTYDSNVVYSQVGSTVDGVDGIELPPQNPFQGTISEIVDKMVKWYSFLYLALIYAATYISKWIPGINKIPNLAWRAIIISGLLAVAFIILKKDALALLLPFVAQINLYELILKKSLGKTEVA